LEGEIPQTLRRAFSPALVDCFFVAIFFETRRVNIHEYAFIHVNTFIHASSFGRRTQKNTHKNNIKIYAYIFIRVYASFGRHPLLLFILTLTQREREKNNKRERGR